MIYVMSNLTFESFLNNLDYIIQDSAPETNNEFSANLTRRFRYWTTGKGANPFIGSFIDSTTEQLMNFKPMLVYHTNLAPAASQVLRTLVNNSSIVI